MGLLQYPPEFYESTTDGSPVIVDLFGVVEGTHVGREFAAHLGISDVWDFGQHKIDSNRADLASLRSLLGTLGDHEKYLHDLERFERLRDLGYDFYFRPGG